MNDVSKSTHIKILIAACIIVLAFLIAFVMQTKNQTTTKYNPATIVTPTPKPTLSPEQLAILEKVKQDEKAAQEKALNGLRKNTDEVQGVTWYYDKSIPTNPTKNIMFLYLGKDSSDIWLRMNIVYRAETWLFVRQYIFNIDGFKWEIIPKYDEFKRDNAYMVVREWYDGSITPETLENLKLIANSQKTILRYNGDVHYYDREITISEKQAIKHILEVYEFCK